MRQNTEINTGYDRDYTGDRRYRNKKNRRFRNRNIFFKAMVLALLPVFCCLVYALTAGHGIKGISLLGSTWNDELFYFKQVEGIISNGYPQGFFGFNESHALKLSFAAWSPVLAFFWIIWGKIFGWTLASPFFCNCVCYGISLAILCLLTAPDWKKVMAITVTFMTFSMNARYVLSCMPEVYLWGAVLIFYGTALGENIEKREIKHGIMLCLGMILTLMRPYMITMLLLPLMLAFFERDRKKRAGLLGTGILAVILTLLIYAFINHYYTAEYFAQIYNTEWLYAFRTGGIAAGMKAVGDIIASGGVRFLDIYYRIRLAFTGHQPDGVFYLLIAFQIVVYAFGAIADLIGQKKERAVIGLHFMLSSLLLLLAVVLLYKPVEGSKHLLVFIVPGMILSVFFGKKEFLRSLPVWILCLILTIIKLPGYQDFVLPYEDEKITADYGYWEKTFDEGLKLKEVETPDFQNTVIWVYDDTSGGGQVITDWHMLYAVPEGFGINCCKGGYVAENLGNISSGYIFTSSEGSINAMLTASESWERIGERGNCVLFKKVRQDQKGV